MPLPSFDDLPFNKRPDLTPYLLHMTKNTDKEDEDSAFDNLVSILKTGRIWGSSRKRGFIRGPNKAACFMDVPFASLKYVLTPENTDRKNPRYEPLGIARSVAIAPRLQAPPGSGSPITKSHAYDKGCRPVLYLSNEEIERLGIPAAELWRVVRLERNCEGWINWVHEREWRCKGAFRLPKTIHAAVVRSTREAKKLRDMIYDDRDSFKCMPDAILPASVICQGLLK